MKNWLRRWTLGRRGERFAARQLRRWGYRILEKNVRLGKYEIDIIAREGNTVVFVEVKTRRRGDFLPPETNVTLKKQRHIRNAAHRYMQQVDDGQTYYRFDIVSVLLPERGKPQATLFRNAFPDQ